MAGRALRTLSWGSRLAPVRFVLSVPSGVSPSKFIERCLESHPEATFRVRLDEGWDDAEWDFLTRCPQLAIIDIAQRNRGATAAAESALRERLRNILFARFARTVLVEDEVRRTGDTPFLPGFGGHTSWDGICGVRDIEQLSFRPGALCIKPARFGSLSALVEIVEHCRTRGIVLYTGYGGELSVGYDQNQCLASLLFPEAPNDLAPPEYYRGGDMSGLPGSPLALPYAPAPGFHYRWGSPPDPWFAGTHPEKKIKRRREELGIEQQVAAAAGAMDFGTYCDLELYEDECRFGARLGSQRRLYAFLGLDMLDVLGYKCAFCDGALRKDEYSLPRHELIRTRREQMGLSREGLEKRLEWRPGTITQGEEDPGYLDGWSGAGSPCIEDIADLATVMDLPIQVLFGVECERCRVSQAKLPRTTGGSVRSVIAALAACLPEDEEAIRGGIHERLDKLAALFLLPALAKWIVSALRAGQGSADFAKAAHALDALESLARAHDDELSALLAVGFLRYLPRPGEPGHDIRDMLGPELRRELERLRRG